MTRMTTSIGSESVWKNRKSKKILSKQTELTTSIRSEGEIIRKRTGRQTDISNYRVASLLKSIGWQNDIGSCRVEFSYHKKQIEGGKILYLNLL